MSPDMLVRIVGKNQTAGAFGQVAKDAKMASAAVVKSGAEASLALETEAAATLALKEASQLGVAQQMSLMHAVRGVSEQLALGVSPGQALTAQMSHLSYVFSGQGGLMGGLKSIGTLAGGLVTRFWPVAAVVGVITTGIAAMTTEINRNQKQHVSFGEVVQATWQLASEGILKRFQPVLDFFGNLWNTISPYIAHAINGIIGGFDLAVRNIGTLWNTLPSVVGEGAINAANAVLGAIDNLISKNRAQVASYLIQAGSALGPFGAGLTTAGASLASGSGSGVKPLDNPFSGSTKNMMSELSKNGTDVARLMATDGYTALIGARARALDTANKAAEAGSKKAKSTLGDLSNSMGKLTEKTNAFADAAKSAFSNLGTGLIDAFKKGGNVAMNVLDMLLGKVGQFGESLLNSGLNSLLDIGLRGLFSGLGGGTAIAGGALGGLPHFANGGSGVIGGSGGTDSKLFMAKVTPGEPYAFGKDAVRGMGGGPTVQIHISGSRSDAAEIARHVGKVLPDAIANYNRNQYRRAG